MKLSCVAFMFFGLFITVLGYWINQLNAQLMGIADILFAGFILLYEKD